MNGRRILALLILLIAVFAAGVAVRIHQSTAQRAILTVPLPATRPSDLPPPTALIAPPATQPVAVAAPPLAPTPVRASLIVGSQEVWFPPALISFTTSHGKLSARLVTDDPPEAIEADYVGNSFDLDMPLNVASVDELRKAMWIVQGSQRSDQPDDSPHGVFIHGQQQRLHPQVAVAQFYPQKNGQVVVLLRGWFMMVDTAKSEPGFSIPQRVMVQGRIVAQIAKP